MCADRASRELHLKHRILNSRLRPIDSERKIREVKTTKRGRIHVPLVLAAVSTGIIDALGPDEILGTTRLPQVPLLTNKPTKEEIAGERELRRLSRKADRQEWLKDHPFVAPTAA